MSPIADPEPDGDIDVDAQIEVLFVGHSTVLVSLAGVRVLTDPFLRPRLGPLQRHGSLPDASSLRPDVVVVSHGHRDHFDRRSLAAVATDGVIVAPRGLAGPIRREAGIRADVIEVVAGNSVRVGDITITATPARHWISPGAPRAEPVGYLLSGGGAGGDGGGGRGGRVYFAGDTGAFEGMRTIAAGVDLALLPVWTWGPHLGPGHLGPRSAAAVVAELEPAAAVPIHWGTLYPRGLHRIWRRPLDQPADRFAARVREATPAVDVRVLRPGESSSFAVRSELVTRGAVIS